MSEQYKMAKRKLEDAFTEAEHVAKRVAVSVAEKATSEEIKKVIVSNIVEEVNRGGCSCGPWSLRIVRTPTTSSLPKPEVSQKEESSSHVPHEPEAA